MEAKLVVILAACLLIFFSNGGDAQCTVKDLVVTQTTAPSQPGGTTYPEHLVKVKNTCVCMQLNVKMACAGFDSSIDVIPAGTITPDGGNALCTLDGGRPVYGNRTVTFNYAWSTNISFRPVSAYIECS